jgi:hypothetical protein
LETYACIQKGDGTLLSVSVGLGIIFLDTQLLKKSKLELALDIRNAEMAMRVATQ